MGSDSFSVMPRGRQILSVVAEINRAGHWLKRGNRDEAARCYGYSANLMNRLLKLDLCASEIREYGLCRDELAKFASGQLPDISFHAKFACVVLQLHPDSWNALHPRTS